MAGVGLASAQSSTTGTGGLVDKIAQKFNLNKADVQKVFDEDRAVHQAEHEQKENERLDQAVKDGKITQAQEDLIKAKVKELQAKREAARDAMKDKTKAERKATMDAERTDLEKWAKGNNIPAEYLLFGPHGHGGPGHDGGVPGDKQ